MTARHVEIRVTGVVQGVGFRPFVHRHAQRLGLAGHVGNDSAGVFVDAQGDPAAVADLLVLLADGPPMARVEEVVVRDLPVGAATGFAIAASTDALGSTSIPPDTAVCDACLAELRDPDDRRFGYPFIACTECGPRYTITTGLPYDRPQTTMADFPLCPDCQREYDDPTSRRFHAQPTCCPACGPRLDTPVEAIAAALRDGQVVALKGIGGYHLLCDARNTEAVGRLRARKQRGDKPFALLAATLDVAREVVELDDAATAALTGPERPIVLAPTRDASLQPTTAPGHGRLGLMLAYAPVHHLLFDAGAPALLVATSGNVSDEPICTDADEAKDRLAHLADLIVHHDRRIHVPCDDSVLQARDGGPVPVRRSRGFAPLPLPLPVAAPPLLAVGGELKTTLAVAQGRHAWLSQHIGDTENLETLAVLARTSVTLAALQRVRPEVVVSDRHPAYLSRRWAGEEAARLGARHLTVQHHHAHAASLLAEHRVPAGETVLCVAFDGTGYGDDGSIWGGELLLGSYDAVTRVGHLRAVGLPGGDAAVRRPLRTALAHLAASGVPTGAGLAPLDRAAPGEAAIVARMLETGTGCTPTTSVGRLFDAIASLLDVRQDVEYEGQAAMELEAIAASAPPAPDDPAWVPAVELLDGTVRIDPSPAIAAAVAAHRGGVPVARAARAFHGGLAAAVTTAAQHVRSATGVARVGLTGGVFANALLSAECERRLRQAGFEVLTHRLVPCNDGGLSLGQAAVVGAGGARDAHDEEGIRACA